MKLDTALAAATLTDVPDAARAAEVAGFDGVAISGQHQFSPGERAC